MPFNTPKVSPPAFNERMTEDTGFPSSEFYNWILITLLPAIEQVPAVGGGGTTPPLELTGQAAAIPLAPLGLGSLTTGQYRINVYTRITTPDGVSSSVRPFISFIDGGVTCQIDGVAMTSDAINEPLGQSFIADVQQPGPISFGVNYSSGTPGQAIYKVTVTAERIQ